MNRVLPILFNTDMVQAILEGRKTVTRRIIKQDKIAGVLNSQARKGNPDIPDKNFIECLADMPYVKEDILYVRETWTYHEEAERGFIYKARCPKKLAENKKWHPSIHMPKEAARIWLKVTDVRAERLQDMTLDDFLAEGVVIRPEAYYNDQENAYYRQAKDSFMEIWNATIKKSDFELYGWHVNPWVWAIEFEQCEKPEG